MDARRHLIFLAMIPPAVLSGTGAVGPAAPVPVEKPADVVARRFLAHLASNGPIAGEFRVETEIDADQRITPPAPPGPGLRVVPEPLKQTLVCRWAWADKREVCQSLPGSAGSNLFGLLTLPEGSLLGVTDHQYNLTESQVYGAAWTRPADFYFLGGGRHDWSAAFAKAAYTTEPADGHPAGFVTLVATTEKSRTKLVVEQATGHLREASVYYGGRLSWKLVVEELAVSKTDGRAFPRKASTATYLFNGAKSLRKTTLTATRLDFPTERDCEKEFHFPVRKGALIADWVRNMAITPDAETDAADVITKDLPRKPFSKPGPQ